VRLNAYLARAGVASRRAAETLITEGTGRVDGKPAQLGMKVDPARQRITVGGRPIKLQERRWIAFH
jgi:23S rRNA pseudouridine2605 synthase